MSQDTILLGHGLENDLRTLRIMHHRCVDTAILFEHPRGFPFRKALRDLCIILRIFRERLQSTNVNHFSAARKNISAVRSRQVVERLAIPRLRTRLRRSTSSNGSYTTRSGNRRSAQRRLPLAPRARDLSRWLSDPSSQR